MDWSCAQNYATKPPIYARTATILRKTRSKVRYVRNGAFHESIGAPYKGGPKLQTVSIGEKRKPTAVTHTHTPPSRFPIETAPTTFARPTFQEGLPQGRTIEQTAVHTLAAVLFCSDVFFFPSFTFPTLSPILSLSPPPSLFRKQRQHRNVVRMPLPPT